MNAVRFSAALLLLCSAALEAQPKCTNASLNGTLYYAISGSIKPNGSTPENPVSYAEQGQVIADGNGNLTSGTSTTSIAGVIASGVPVTGTYTIHQDCSGTATLTAGAASFTTSLQVVNGGGLTLSTVTSSAAGELGEIRFYRAANATGASCGNGSLNGAYGLLLSGGTYGGGSRVAYESATQIIFDGQGNITSDTGQVTTNTQAAATGFNATGTYSLSSNCSGTAQLVLPNSQSPLNYNIAKVEGGVVLFFETDTNATVSGAAQPQLLQQVLPQFVFGSAGGAGWASTLYFSNPTSGTVSFPVTFTADNGTPLSVPGVGASKTVTIAPNGTATISAPSTGAFAQGYASVALPAGIASYAVFRQTVPNNPTDQESTVGLKNANQTATSIIWDETISGYVTAVAILNTSGVATTVTITVYDTNGNLIGTSMQQVPAGQKVSGNLHSFANLSGMVGKAGSALFSVSTGSVSVLALRFAPGQAFTSIPTVDLQ